MGSFQVVKGLNNNVIVAKHSTYDEVVIIGKGIGFNRKKGDVIESDLIEKMFVLKNEKEQEDYKRLLNHIDDSNLEVFISALDLIKERTNNRLNEHIHVALTDHLMFAITRLKQGMAINNPFLIETKTLYPFEYDIAKDVVSHIERKTGIHLPIGEVGFIALHIHSAIVNKNVSLVNQHSQLIASLVKMIEEQLNTTIDKESIDYMRLVRHLRFAIERVVSGETVEEPDTITELLKQEYPICYNLSWKLIKVMQQALKRPVFEAEAVYLTMHLQRIQKKIK